MEEPVLLHFCQRSIFVMEIFDNIFYRKSAVPERLLGYGFKSEGKEYIYEKLFSDSSLKLVFKADIDGHIDYKVH